jgi:hypothetical protein
VLASKRANPEERDAIRRLIDELEQEGGRS